MADPRLRSFSLLKLFPADDVGFVTYVEATLDAVGESAGPDELERRLRECYPSVRVRAQVPLAMNGAPRPHWYVFRDGRAVSPHHEDE